MYQPLFTVMFVTCVLGGLVFIHVTLLSLNLLSNTYVTLKVHATAPWHIGYICVIGPQKFYFYTHILDMLLEVYNIFSPFFLSMKKKRLPLSQELEDVSIRSKYYHVLFPWRVLHGLVWPVCKNCDMNINEILL